MSGYEVSLPLGSPWVDEVDVAIPKIIGSSRQLCSTGSGNGGDLGTGLGDGLAKSAAVSRNPRKIQRRVAVKTENPAREVLGKQAGTGAVGGGRTDRSRADVR